MAGLEVLFASAAPAMTCPQDALVCFLHWEVVTNGYYGLGTGDQVCCEPAWVEGSLKPEAQRPALTVPKPGPEASDAALLRAWRWCQQLAQSVCVNSRTRKTSRHSSAVA